MKSVVLREGPRVEVTDLPVPQIGPGELLVEMRACGLCGTDIEKLRGQYTAAMPVLGHEAVGVVAKAGPGAGFREGERVFPHHHVPCGECYFCRKGSETMCDRYKTSNLDPGGFSEYFRVPRWNVDHGGVLRLPDDVRFEEASLIEPVGCCLRGLERCGVQPGDSVLVVGAGPVGMMHSLILRSRGARVIVTDVSAERLRLARGMDAGRVVDAASADVPASVRGETGGRGVDLAIAAAGSKKAILQALRSVRKGGKVCIFGVPPKGTVLEYDISDPYNSEVTILSSYAADDRDTASALSLIASRTVDFAPLITHRFGIEDFQEAVEISAGGKGMKVVIAPGGGSAPNR